MSILTAKHEMMNKKTKNILSNLSLKYLVFIMRICLRKSLKAQNLYFLAFFKSHRKVFD